MAGENQADARPPDLLDALFSREVLDRLGKRQNPSDELKYRLRVITATDPDGVDGGTRFTNRGLLAHRSSWEEYAEAMELAGFLDDDIKGRLTGEDDDGFRSALSECMTCWFLSRRLGLTVSGRHEGRPGTAIDFGIERGGGRISVEVKSPYVARPKGNIWFGNHVHVVQPTVDYANKQFAEGRSNVLALVPLVEAPLLAGRREFVEAFLGEQKIVLTMDVKRGRAVGDPRAEFFPTGKLLKRWPDEARFTRIGAILVLKEFVNPVDIDEGRFETIRSWFVIHNPNCPNPIPTEVWGDCPQLVVDEADGETFMRWTDGKPIFE